MKNGLQFRGQKRMMGEPYRETATATTIPLYPSRTHYYQRARVAHAFASALENGFSRYDSCSRHELTRHGREECVSARSRV